MEAQRGRVPRTRWVNGSYAADWTCFATCGKIPAQSITSNFAMTRLRVWAKLERIDKDFNFRVVGEGKFFLYSGLFEQIYATEAESKLTTSELYNYKGILISGKM